MNLANSVLASPFCISSISFIWESVSESSSSQNTNFL